MNLSFNQDCIKNHIKLAGMVHLFIVRHGITSAIEQRHLQGSTDSPLSPRGRAEAHLTAAALRDSSIEYAFTSPMGRAMETADIICKQLDLDYQILDELREMDFGFYEGRNYFDAPDDSSTLFERLSILGRIIIAQITGESLIKVGHRASRAWLKISQMVGDGRVLIVSHGALINYLLKYLLLKSSFQAIQPVQTAPCSITELIVTSPGNAEILRLSDIRHLKNQDKI
jgi:broad specificity phosphatase PhoE